MEPLRALARLTNPFPDANALPTDTDAWRALLRAAERQRLLPTLRYQLSKQGLLPKLPNDFATVLDRATHAAAAMNAVLFRTADDVRREALREGVTFAPLKGLYLADRHYAHEERAMLDLDFLIRKEDIARCETIMERLGFSPLTEGLPLDFEKRFGSELKFQKKISDFTVVVECRWDMTTGAPMRKLFNIDMNAFWRRAVTGPGGAATLSREDHLLFMAFHLAVLHSFSRLLWMCDIHRLVTLDAPNWNAVAERAQSYGIAHIVYYALKFTREYYGTALPDEIMRRMRPDRETISPQTIERCLVSEGHIPELGFVRMILSGSRMRYASAMLFPGLDYLAARHGTSRAGAIMRMASRPFQMASLLLRGK